MKVKRADYQAASSLIEEDHIEKTGLKNSNVDMAEAVFDPLVETVTCPACATRFKPDRPICPECGLQFG